MDHIIPNKKHLWDRYRGALCAKHMLIPKHFLKAEYKELL